MGTRYNAAAILAGMGATVSQEDNDLNININADHEGDNDNGGGDDGAADFDNSAPAETVEVDEALTEDTSGTPETAELDTVESGEEVEQVAEQIEDTNDVAAGLEGLVLQLATISTEGIEITPFIANSMNTQYDFIVRKFPRLKRKADGSPVIASVESWTVGQDSETTVSMESIMEKLGNAKAAVIKFLQDLWEKIKSLAGSVSATASIMRKKAQSIKGANMSGRQADRITVPALLGNTPITPESVKALADIVRRLASAKLDAAKWVNEGWSKAAMALKQHMPVGEKEFLGNFKVEFKDATPRIVEAEGKKNTERQVISTRQIPTIADAVVDLANAIDAYKSSQGERKKANDILIAELKKDARADEPTAYGRFQRAREASTKWGQYNGFENRIIKKAIAVGNAVNNVLSASLPKASAKK